jgi:hypothetical protein
MRHSNGAAAVLWGVLLLVGCPAEYEGDAPGECSDDADNDQDGLFDCDDPGCAGAGSCADDDDSVVGDDDDAGDDDAGDDDVTDDDDAADDDDSAAAEAELVEATPELIEISAPNYGIDLSTDAELVTVEGVAREDVVAVAWSSDQGPSGDADGTIAWSVADIPLVAGDNLLVFTAVNGDGDEDAAELLVVHTPGVPLVSDLVLSETILRPDEILTVDAWVEVADTDGFETAAVGPVDASGALIEVWGSLNESAQTPGLLEGTISASAEVEGTLEVRAVVTYDGVSGATTPVTVRVQEAPTEDELQWTLDLSEDVWLTWDLANPDGDPEGARDAAIELLLATPGVIATGASGEDSYGFWWVVEPGIIFLISGNPDGTQGGAGRGEELPGFVYPSAGPGVMRSFTSSSAGLAGGPPEDAPRNALDLVTDKRIQSLSVLTFGDDTTMQIRDDFETHACPDVHAEWEAPSTVVDFSDVAAQWPWGFQHLSTHGDNVRLGSIWRHRFGGKTTGGVVALQVAETCDLSMMVQYRRELESGKYVVHKNQQQGGPFMFTPKWVRANARPGTMPDSVVFQSSCRSGRNRSMWRAYSRAGAAYYVGFTDYVLSANAQPGGRQFWTEMREQNTAGGAFGAMQGDWPTVAPESASPVAWGNGSKVLGMEDMANLDFESSTTGWAGFPPNGVWGVGGSLAGIGGIGPADGSAMGWGWFKSSDVNYSEWYHRGFCPIPGQDLTITFKWRIVTGNMNSCSSGVDVWMVGRIDKDEGNESFWSTDWAAFCPSMTSIGCCMASPWATESVTMPAPMTANPETMELAFGVGGYAFEFTYGLVDTITVSQ